MRALRFSLRPRTLSRQLMLGVSTLVILVLLAVGALWVYTLRGYVNSLIDVEVAQSLRSLEHSLAQSPQGDPLTGYEGQLPGTLIAVLRDGRIVGAAVFGDGGARDLSPMARSVLGSLDWTDGSPRSVTVDGMGDFRVGSQVADSGVRLISARSLRAAHTAIATRTAWVVGIIALAALVAAVGTVILVRKSLRPLRHVAATAARAATVPLADDGQRITTRVRQADTDPDNEVGIVGETLNRLLANVDSALATRTESERRIRRFLTDASHELRTPLATIRGYAELTRQDGSTLPETTEYALTRIESESRRMASLVDDMFLLTRLDERRGLRFQPVDVCALVADAVNDVAVTSHDHGFAATMPDEAVWIRGDSARLHQVLGNLLSNTVVHTPPGTTVAVGVQRSGAGAVRITVADDGPGIDSALLPDLFERFVRADKARSRAHDSTGLGLAIVASITEAHGGSVDVTSGFTGTTFSVLLPADLNRSQTHS